MPLFGAPLFSAAPPNFGAIPTTAPIESSKVINERARFQATLTDACHHIPLPTRDVVRNSVKTSHETTLVALQNAVNEATNTNNQLKTLQNTHDTLTQAHQSTQKAFDETFDELKKSKANVVEIRNKSTKTASELSHVKEELEKIKIMLEEAEEAKQATVAELRSVKQNLTSTKKELAEINEANERLSGEVAAFHGIWKARFDKESETGKKRRRIKSEEDNEEHDAGRATEDREGTVEGNAARE